LNKHIISNKILADKQYGFRSNTSTETAIYQLTNKILKSLDNKEWVGGIFCDLSKAFDCVDHDILLGKLKFCGITGTANKLIELYLPNRFQSVKIRDKQFVNCYSVWDKVKPGYPQGSVFGQQLFLLYINDLPKSVNDILSPILFADDKNLICTQKKFHKFNDELELVFQKINRWLQADLLTINLNKTNPIQFTSKNIETTQAQIKYRGNYIQNTNKVLF
jgi:hypothetical protein